MSLFWIVSALLIVLTLVVCIRSLLRARQQPETTADDKAAQLQQRLEELDSDLDNGVITTEEAENSRKEIQLSILNRQNDRASTTAATPTNNRMTALFLVAFVPVFVVLLYNYLGRPDLVAQAPQQVAQQGPVSAEQIKQMVSNLEQRLQENPEDSEGWQMLYRSYMVLERYDQALEVAEKLNELEGENPEALLRYVDALAMANNQQLAGKPTEIIERILELEPDNASAIWLAGMAANERGDYQQAIDYWEGLLPRIETGTEPSQQLQQLIAIARQQLAADSGEVLDPDTISITVNVYLAPDLKQGLNEKATLFVYARSQDGNPVPIALVKESITDFPMQITLDNTDVMAPSIKLADYNQVQLIARISGSGQDKPESGDLIGAVSNISPRLARPIDLIIRDKIQL